MRNPYKEFTSINPQKEKGHRRIANDIFYALNMAKLSGAEYQVIYTIINMSWGFNQKSCVLSYKQIANFTNLSRVGVIKTVSKLVNQRIILSTTKLVNHSIPLKEYQFNKFYDTWIDKTGKPLFTTSQIQLVNKLTKSVIQTALELVNQRITPIERLRNKTNKERPKNYKQLKTKKQSGKPAYHTSHFEKQRKSGLQKIGDFLPNP